MSIGGGGWTWPAGRGPLARAGLDGLGDEILGEFFWMKFRGGDGGRTVRTAQSENPFLIFAIPAAPLKPQYFGHVPKNPKNFQNLPSCATGFYTTAQYSGISTEPPLT